MIIAVALALQPFSTPLESLDLSLWAQGFGTPQVGKSVSRRPLTVAGKMYAAGMGSHAPGIGRFGLDGRVESVAGSVAVDDGGRGSVVFEICVDGKPVWSSGVVRGNQAPVAFDLDLKGAKEVVLVMGDAFDGNGGDHADWLDVRFAHSGAKPRPLKTMRTFSILPDRPRQTIDNFAASDSWTVEPLINWPEAHRRRIAELLFDRKKGIGLSGWRHNIGGGINHETITNPLRTVDTYEVSEGVYDWDRCPGQRWMLRAAKEAGVESLIAYSITPPRRLALNGYTNGTDGQGTMNLKPGAEGAYARYLADIVEHFRDQGYPFSHISPINEPDYEWNGVPNASGQEGSRASNRDILAVGKAVHDEVARRGLGVKLLTPEASSAQIGLRPNEGMERKYKAPYGNYIEVFAKDRDWLKAVDPVYAYHAYWTDKLENIVPVRRDFRKALDQVPGMRVWQTEYCQMSGPRGEGGWGRDVGMTLALNVARLIHFDMTIVEANAWQWWLAVSDSDYKDGLVYVDDLARSTSSIFPSKTLWAMGNFSRYVRPGFQRIEVDGPQDDIAGLFVSAYRDSKSGRVVAVLVNCDTRSEGVTLNLPGKWSSHAYITSDRPGHDLKELRGPTVGQPWTVPSRSVVTVVCDPGQG